MGSGGGGSSGKSDWPDYMKTMHGSWLTAFDVLIPVTNPYLGVVAYDPTTPLADLATALTAFKAYYTSVGLNLTAFKSVWSGWLTTVSSGLTAALTAALDINGIPEFEAGMRDINAVQTSSFVLGKSMLYARVGLEAAQLALQNTNQAVDLTMKYGEHLRAQFVAQWDYAKFVIIALKEQKDMQIQLDVDEAKWPFFEYREAGALLGSIGSSAAMQSSAKPNPTASALGGAMAGAGVGAAIGSAGPQVGVGGTLWGAAIGAIIGGIGGYFASQ